MRLTKLLSTALGAAMFLGLTNAADAKTGQTTGKKHAGAHGRIVSINRKLSQFTLSTGGRVKHTVRVTVQAGTVIKFHKKAGTFAKLKVGDRVTVRPSAAHPAEITDAGHGKHRTTVRVANRRVRLRRVK